MAKQHDYRGEGGVCKVCGQGPSADTHFSFAVDPEKPHAFVDDGSGKCKYCGMASTADMHEVASKAALKLAAEPDATDAHGFQDDGTGKCKVCGLGQDAPAHSASGDAPPSQAPMGARYQATLLTEGVLSRDGRMIAAGASFWGDLPMTLMGMIEDTGLGGHSGSQVSGQIQNIVRASNNDIIGVGQFDGSDWAVNIQRLVQDGTMSGISVDLAPVEWRIEAKPMDEEEGGGLLLLAAGETTAEPAGEGREVVAEEKMDDMVFVVTKGEIMGATVCPMPAFANAEIHLTASGQPAFVRLYGSIELVEETAEEPQGAQTARNPQGAEGSMIALYPTPEEATALASPDGNPAESLHLTLFYFPGEIDKAALTAVLEDFSAEQDEILTKTSGAAMFTAEDPEEHGGFPYVLLVDDPRIDTLRNALAVRLDEAGLEYAKNHGFTAHITQAYDDPADFAIDMEQLGQALSFTKLSYSEGDKVDEFALGTNSLTASAAGLVPELPPVAWFADPHFTEPTPLTVDDSGRVYGHAATWNVCHVAHTNSCIVAPKSAHDYAYFMLGEVVTEEGEHVAVGQITLDTGHAPDSYGRRKTRAHYDDTGTAAADVVVGEDEHGVWVAGALRADATAGQVRKLRGAKLSGDWRDVNGNLELVGLLAVNVPGFPVPRPKAQLGRGRSGDVKGLALVAAGIVGEAESPKPQRPGGLARLGEDSALRILSARAEGGIAAMAALIA